MQKQFVILALSVLAGAQPALTVGGDYATEFEAFLTRQAERHWDAREQKIGALHNAADIHARQTYVQAAVAKLIGGLPSAKTPLRPQVTGQFEREGYRVENIIFESQPGFRVTANLYLPTVGKPPFPAILGVAGHSVNGKASATYQTAFIGFVKQGFAVLAFDPPGQGERSEYFDSESGRSKVGIGTAEHSMAGLQCLLTGHTMARYEIWDGVRALDYLVTRPEIDSRRIAIAGNSGGGTQAAYLAALEPRLAAVVSSCYMTRWRELWSGPGPQDAEQVFPGFLSSGLDFGDFALAYAPRPYLMTTAIQDFFPIAGARATYKQSQRLFDLLAGGDKAVYFEYDDTHGWSRPRREAAYRFLGKWLQNREIAGQEPAVQPEEESLLYATSTGQVATAGGSETVQSLNLQHARRLAANRAPLNGEGLQRAIGLLLRPGVPAARLIGEGQRGGIRVEKLELTVEDGVHIPALLYHAETPRTGRAVLFASSLGKGADADVMELVKNGTMVLSIDPRGMGESYKPPTRSGYRQGYQLAARAMLIGRNLVEMQTADLGAAVSYLQTRTKEPISLFVKGAVGPAAMFAAALDERIAELAIERSVTSYMDIVAARIHEGLDQVVIPGILAHADLPDALRLMGSRPVTMISPIHPNGQPMLRGEVITPARVVLRGEGWPLRQTLPAWIP